jgi:hypothetical protein
MNHSTPFKPLYSSELFRVENDGEEIFEEYFDDEIKNGNVGGEFDYDMDYDDQGEEVDYENGEDVGAEMGGFDYENENDFVNETVDVYSHGGVEEQGEGKEEGVEDIGEGLTFEIEDIDAIPQRPEPMEDADVAPSDEDLVEGETIVNEEEEGLTEYEIIGNEKNGDPDENEKYRDTILGVHFKSVVSSWKREEDNWILKIFVKIQGADLWRFDKHKKRTTLGTGEYAPVMTCTLFCGTQGIEVWMGKHPLPSCAVHKWSYRIVLPDLV